MAELGNLDRTDLAILRELQSDGRMANVELAARVGLSPSATLERVRRLEREGVIAGYVARVDPKALGKHMTVFVNVSLRAHSTVAVRDFEGFVAAVGEVLECHHVAGESDFLLKLMVPDIAALRDVLVERISQIPNVGRIHSTLVLSTSKHELSIPLPEASRRARGDAPSGTSPVVTNGTGAPGSTTTPPAAPSPAPGLSGAASPVSAAGGPGPGPSPASPPVSPTGTASPAPVRRP